MLESLREILRHRPLVSLGLNLPTEQTSLISTEDGPKADASALLGSEFFKARLAQTIAWCEVIENRFRSREFTPEKDFAEVRSRSERREIVTRVAEQRERMLRTFSKESPVRKPSLAGGSLLLYAPDENLFDGAAEYQSDGFFDVNNVPPWDCWLVYSHPYLVSWIPRAAIPPTQAGIDVNPEECIFWAERIWNLDQLE